MREKKNINSGFCRIAWKQSSSTTPDPFQLGTTATVDATACGPTNAYIGYFLD